MTELENSRGQFCCLFPSSEKASLSIYILGMTQLPYASSYFALLLPTAVLHQFFLFIFFLRERTREVDEIETQEVISIRFSLGLDQQLYAK